ncbi:winged helix-turn-helix transcriptional regulator [Natronococcus occultus]|uniref:Transcriptional regulator of sugar metabolism n=1 Tax=Natronococcus occultus SP4 TaxID=694430 RepID=L0K2L3_9EURY|nr:winged helix-turn-helix transcriptional regulator [Natronococcus occultus]AGB38328.1 transcriptional regulator of sugar metabolism [Natronococcus occultus SP4]
MPTDDPSADRTEREILEILAADGPMTVSRLAATLAAHPVTIERQCRDLQRAGRVRRCPGGAFAIDDSGDDARAVGD